MRNTELHGKRSKHKRKKQNSSPDMSEGEVSCDSEDGAIRNNDLKRSLSAESDSSVERVKKHKKKHKKHKRKHKHLEVDAESDPEIEIVSCRSPDPVAQRKNQMGLSRGRDLSSVVERQKRTDGDDRRREREGEDFRETYEFQRVKQEPVFEDNRARQYNMPSRQRHSDSRHRQRSEGEHHSRRHHRREGDHARYERGDHSSSGHRGHVRYHDDRPPDNKPSFRERRHSEEQERGQRGQPDRGRAERGGRQDGRRQWREGEEPQYNPGQPVKQEKTSPHTDNAEPQTFEWGKKADNVKEEKEVAPADKEKPNFGLSGKLTEETNTFNGVVIKYSEPPEARKPRRRWRFYPFKGDKALQTLYIHRQSSYLMGRDRKIADIPIDHPSCSKQHAALQYRLVDFKRENGTAGKRVRPYIIDLESANGTFVNNKKIDAKKYVELLEKDVVKFGFSSREYVLLHEHSKDDDYDDVGDVEGLPEETPVDSQNSAKE